MLSTGTLNYQILFQAIHYFFNDILGLLIYLMIITSTIPLYM